MKNLLKLTGMVVALLVLLTACEKDETNVTDIEGIYNGTLVGVQTKSTESIAKNNQATTEITITDENEIQVHTNSNGFDTTFVMNYYHHNDSAYVCYTGDDFEEMYGHMLGMGYMGGMMDDMHFQGIKQ